MKMEEKIIMLRKKFGWSQEELAEKGVRFQTSSKPLGKRNCAS